MDELACALRSNARLSLILANALFFVTGRCDAVQFGKICLDRGDKHGTFVIKKHPLADSTMSTAPSLPPSHRRLQGDPRSTCRMSRNLLLCPFSRTPGKRSKQSGPITSSEALIRYTTQAYLCSHVGDGRRSDLRHAMDPSVTRPCCFWFLVNGTRRRENMFICL